MAEAKVPVTILTGFLGAGKTTLLNRLLAAPGFGDTAVIVNEFGAVDIDGALVARVGAQAFANSTGCLCCTASGDVRLTLLRLKDDADSGKGPPFRRVVIETSGLADPAPVLQAFMTNDIMLAAFALAGVVTVVDAATGMATLDRFAEAQRQVAVADLVVIAKADLVPEAATGALRHRVAALARFARVSRADALDPAELWSAAESPERGGPPIPARRLPVADPDHGQGHDHDYPHDGHDHPHDGHGDTVSAFCFAAEAAIAPRDLQAAIGALQRRFGPNLLRMKGLVALSGSDDRPAVVHVVQHLVSPPQRLAAWPQGVRTTRLVVIVSGAGRGGLPDLLMQELPGLRPVGAGGGPEPASGPDPKKSICR